MNVIEIDNIELNFNNTEILKAVYLKGQKGKVSGILGRNGSGKTSLLRIIFGELIPNNKLIRIDRKPILKPLYKKGLIKHLPQFHFIPNSTFLKKVFRYYKVSFNAFLMEFSNFKEYKNCRFFELSGGEKRIIETYLVLKSPSEIVLLDEPFSHIAPLYIESIKNIILQEKENKIIFITDHLYKDILDISDTLNLIKDGWCKQINSPEDLIRFKYISSL